MRVGTSWVLPALIVLSACGSKPPAATPRIAPAPPGSEQAAPSEARPVLSPVETPQEIIGVARIASVAKLMDTLSEWTSAPVDWRAQLERRMGPLTELLMLDAPVDVALMLDPESGRQPRFLFAVAAPLNSHRASIERLKESATSTSPLAEGAHYVELPLGECIVAHAMGPSPARLVCSERREWAETLLPYMTRGMPNESFGSDDVFVQLRAETLRARYGDKANLIKLGIPFALREGSIDNPRFDDALSDGLHGLADEVLAWINDIDSVTLRIGLNAVGGPMESQLAFRFGRTTSWASQRLAERAQEAGPPPEVFWALSGKAATAWFTRTNDVSQRAPILNIVAELAEGSLEHGKVPTRLRTRWVKALQRVLATGGAQAAAVVPQAGPEPQPKGHYFWVGEDDDGAADDFLRETVSLLQDRSLRAGLKQEHELDLAEQFKIRRRPTRGGQLGPKAVTYQITLGESARDEPIRIGGARMRLLASEFFIISVRDGKRSWLALSSDEAGAATALTELRKSSQAKGADAAPGQPLTILQQGKYSAALSTSLVGLLTNVVLTTRKPELLERVAKAPNKGRDPILVTSQPSAEGPGLTLGLRIPKGVFRDIVSVVTDSMGAR